MKNFWLDKIKEKASIYDLRSQPIDDCHFSTRDGYCFTLTIDPPMCEQSTIIDSTPEAIIGKTTDSRRTLQIRRPSLSPCICKNWFQLFCNFPHTCQWDIMESFVAAATDFHMNDERSAGWRKEQFLQVMNSDQPDILVDESIISIKSEEIGNWTFHA